MCRLTATQQEREMPVKHPPYRVSDAPDTGAMSPKTRQQLAIHDIIAKSSIAQTARVVTPTYWKGVLVEWITPEAQHTDDAPFCAVMACQCHHDAVRMERYFIGPIEQGVLGIAEAIDRYHAEAGYMARKQAEACAREAVGV